MDAPAGGVDEDCVVELGSAAPGGGGGEAATTPGGGGDPAYE